MSDAPDMSAIRVFVAVARAESFSTGARAVGLTRSAAGKAVARLEERLGARLLHRTTRNVSLTAEGRAFLDRCSQILVDLEEAEAEVRCGGAGPTGVLRLTLPETFGRAHVMPILSAFLKRWPKLTAEVGVTDHIVDIVDEGYDLAVRCGGPLLDTSMIARVIARSGTVVCASPGYVAEHGEPRHAQDLSAHSRLTLRRGEAVRAWRLTTPAGTTVQINEAGRFHTDSGVALRDAAVDGLGVACLPHFLVGPDVAAGRLVPLLEDHGTEDLLIHAVYPHRRHLSAKIRMFVDRLVADLTSAPAARREGA